MNTPGCNPKFNVTSAGAAAENPTNFLFGVNGADGKWWCSKGWSRRWQPQRGTVSVPRTPPSPHLCCITINLTSHIGSGNVGITIDHQILRRLQVFAPAATPDDMKAASGEADVQTLGPHPYLTLISNKNTLHKHYQTSSSDVELRLFFRLSCFPRIK